MKSTKKSTRYAAKKIVVLNREHGAREGTKRARAMDLILASKSCDEVLPRLIKIGADSSFIRFAVETGLVKLAASKAKRSAR
jgi:hypothetical protein